MTYKQREGANYVICSSGVKYPRILTFMNRLFYAFSQGVIYHFFFSFGGLNHVHKLLPMFITKTLNICSLSVLLCEDFSFSVLYPSSFSITFVA